MQLLRTSPPNLGRVGWCPSSDIYSPWDLFFFFGCSGSSLQREGFSSCDLWALLPQSVWDLSSSTTDGTHVFCIGRQILNQWTHAEDVGSIPGQGTKIPHVVGQLSP